MLLGGVAQARDNRTRAPGIRDALAAAMRKLTGKKLRLARETFLTLSELGTARGAMMMNDTRGSRGFCPSVSGEIFCCWSDTQPGCTSGIVC